MAEERIYEGYRFGEGNSKMDILEMEDVEVDSLNDKNKGVKTGKDKAKCDSKDCVLSELEKIALYLCYVCNAYLCKDCFTVHNKTHDFVSIRSEEGDRKALAHMMIERMRSEETRESYLNVEDVKAYGRVTVKHELERWDCDINGICGLQNKRWAVLDSNNQWMKIFSTVTNKLIRYVRFGSQPWDASEIHQESSVSDLASHNKGVFSGSGGNEPNRNHFIAVTFPKIKQIWFIDIDIKPAIKTKTINMEKECYALDFSDDKIFTLCMENFESQFRYSIDILSKEGNHLRVIKVDILLPDCDFAVKYDKIYITDLQNSKVFCLNYDDGKTIAELTLKWSASGGICVDKSDNVYLCGWGHDKVYKLSPDLSEVESLSIDKQYTWRAHRICFTDGKIFVGHSPLRNFVTVIQLT